MSNTIPAVALPPVIYLLRPGLRCYVCDQLADHVLGVTNLKLILNFYYC